MWWTLIFVYVAVAMLMFRLMYLSNLDKTRRRAAQDPYHRKVRLAAEEEKDLYAASIFSVMWPLVIVGRCCWLLYRLVRFIVFPRGIKTKFDREQELAKEQARNKEEYEKALKILGGDHVP